MQYADRNKNMIKARKISKLLIFTTLFNRSSRSSSHKLSFLILNVYPGVIEDKYKSIFKNESLNLTIMAQSLFDTVRDLLLDTNKWWYNSQIQDFRGILNHFARYDQK